MAGNNVDASSKGDQFVSDVGLTYSIVSAVANVLRDFYKSHFSLALQHCWQQIVPLIAAETPMLLCLKISVSDLHRPWLQTNEKCFINKQHAETAAEKFTIAIHSVRDEGKNCWTFHRIPQAAINGDNFADCFIVIGTVKNAQSSIRRWPKVTTNYFHAVNSTTKIQSSFIE